ncbi:TetR/AcrR family transcriptional regulator [Saccharopolyspora sp. ASAGF58]|uniref:TetR/AcrR family transcriptional regulator n=1 Tax=Saccharopolyspora sp. ASAGF58 TaxID=2719023 RepID=UPI00144014BC|nr:TetR/AcrR family transcriptional regulator [Saccharopolyspora sp. ASAGF58]QIZ38011.1 TetR/AcrR family transcriptional regulator [Saccharopolyspora sp. ASAGF58]
MEQQTGSAATSTAAFEQRRAEIVELAAQLFDANGYAQTNMISIARAASLRKASLYHYFRSKAEILVYIHRAHTEALFADLEKASVPGTAPEQRLRSVTHAIVHRMRYHKHSVRVFFEHDRELPPDAAREIKALRRRYRMAVIGIIEDGIREGSIRPIDPYYATMAVFGVTNWVYQWFEGDPGHNPDKLGAILWDFVWHGLRS